jgi:hypothetical protein
LFLKFSKSFVVSSLFILISGKIKLIYPTTLEYTMVAEPVVV